jgi:hypothetical protein
MSLRDYLMPGEEIRFQSNGNIRYGNKPYRVILSDRRILLYARRGALFKTDDVVTRKFNDLQGVRYTEQGLISKRGVIHVQGITSEMALSGPAGEIKTLYQQMMQFL